MSQKHTSLSESAFIARNCLYGAIMALGIAGAVQYIQHQCTGTAFAATATPQTPKKQSVDRSAILPRVADHDEMMSYHVSCLYDPY